MSDANHEARGWRFHVQDMIEFSEKVLSYTKGLDQATFIADDLTYDATLRNLELVGEAATHIPRLNGAKSSQRETAWLTATWVWTRTSFGTSSRPTFRTCCRH